MPDGQLLIGGTLVPRRADTEDVPLPLRRAGGRQVAVAAAADATVRSRRRNAAPRYGGRPRPLSATTCCFRAAALVEERALTIAALLSAENGKTISEARAEVGRPGHDPAGRLQGTQLYGDTLPLDANRGTGQDKIGLHAAPAVRRCRRHHPVQLPVAAGPAQARPALAAGNAVVLKPARATPLTALALARAFVDAGLPEGVLSVLTGPGGELGDALVADPRVRKISFTGSTAVGEQSPAWRASRSCRWSWVLLPGRSSCRTPTSRLAADAVAPGGYANAGQVCISVQRVSPPEIR